MNPETDYLHDLWNFSYLISDPLLLLLPLLHLIALLRFRANIFLNQPLIAYFGNLLYVWAVAISIFNAVFDAIHSAGTRGVWNFQLFSFAFAAGGPRIAAWSYLGFIFCGLTIILHYITIAFNDPKANQKRVEQSADGKTPESLQPLN